MVPENRVFPPLPRLVVDVAFPRYRLNFVEKTSAVIRYEGF